MKQEKALALLKSGKNVFLTGSAGTGKTYVLNQYIDYLKARKVAVAITASTGIAATHMNGQTIHSWSGIGIKDSISKAYIDKLKQKKFFTKRMDAVKVLIIDEISMLHKRQLDLVNLMLKYFKDPLNPFGGVQVVFSGDFFQLPPVGDAHESSRDKFAFMSQAWVEAEPIVCYLTKQYRQKEGSLQSILNEIRKGEVGDDARKVLDQSIRNAPAELEIPQLYTHNVDVDRINKQQLEQLDNPEHVFEASTKGNDKLIPVLKKSVLTDEKLVLKKGAKVMFIKNNPDMDIVNGTLGEVVSFNDEGLPVVRKTNGLKVEVEEDEWAIEDEKGKSLASFKQIPLKLAWAVTIHKSQGMTLDAAQIDLNKTFERGQGYVALSRLKSIDGLYLQGYNDRALELDPLASRADQRFQELAQEADQEYTIESLEQDFDAFIKHCGGLIDAKAIKKEKYKKKKQASHLITKEFIEKEMPLELIAEERGVTVSTICTHIMKLAEHSTKINMDYLFPDKRTMRKVRKAYENHQEGNTTSLKEIHTACDGEVTYQEIKLALASIMQAQKWSV